MHRDSCGNNNWRYFNNFDSMETSCLLVFTNEICLGWEPIRVVDQGRGRLPRKHRHLQTCRILSFCM